MDRLEAWLLSTAGSPLTFVVVFLVLAVGVIVIFLPSESLVVAVAALLLARPDRDLRVPVLVVTSALGLTAGDLLLYALARRWQRRGRTPDGSSPLGALRAKIDKRVTDMRSRFSTNPLTTMIFMRLVPVGRASSDVVAAEVGLSTRRFATYALVGGLVYGVYCTAIAAIAYPLVQKYPIPSTIGAVVIAIVLSSVVDRIDKAVRARRHPPATTR